MKYDPNNFAGAHSGNYKSKNQSEVFNHYKNDNFEDYKPRNPLMGAGQPKMPASRFASQDSIVGKPNFAAGGKKEFYVGSAMKGSIPQE